MKVTVGKNWGASYATFVSQGCQSFTIREGPKSECLWFAKMFRKALRNHDAEKVAKDMAFKRESRKGT